MVPSFRYFEMEFQKGMPLLKTIASRQQSFLLYLQKVALKALNF